MFISLIVYEHTHNYIYGLWCLNAYEYVKVTSTTHAPIPVAAPAPASNAPVHDSTPTTVATRTSWVLPLLFCCEEKCQNDRVILISSIALEQFSKERKTWLNWSYDCLNHTYNWEKGMNEPSNYSNSTYNCLRWKWSKAFGEIKENVGASQSLFTPSIYRSAHNLIANVQKTLIWSDV